MREFTEFLKQYGVVGLAIAVIIGGKANAMVGGLVDGLLMPFIGALLPGGEWRTAKVLVGPVALQPGLFIGAAIDFLIVALLVYWFSKTVLKEETVAKK